MDFWIDMGMAVMMRLLRDRRELKRYRPLFLKLAAAIQAAYASDADFAADLKAKAAR